MEHIKNMEWFKDVFSQKLENYDLKYKNFDNGDFGSLEQVEFNSTQIGGNIDFWSLGYLGIFIWDYKKEEIILNTLINPDDNDKKEDALEILNSILFNTIK